MLSKPIYKNHQELVAWLRVQGVSAEIVAKIDAVNECDEWTLLQCNQNSLIEHLNLTILQAKSFMKFLYGDIETQVNSNAYHSTNNALRNEQSLMDMSQFDRKYKLVEPIKSGSFGKVYKVERKEKPYEIRAVKLIKDNEMVTINDAFHEALVTAKLSHENIINVTDVSMCELTKQVLIEMEFMEYGTLHDQFIDKKRKPSQKMLVSILKQLLAALECLQKKQLVHRDIKLSNILVRKLEGEEIEVCLADLGLSKSFNASISSIGGTKGYIAPEVLDEKIVKYSIESDLFALGACMFYLMTMNEKATDCSYATPYQLHQMLFSNEIGYSQSFKSIVLEMLNRIPEERNLVKIIEQVTSVSLTQELTDMERLDGDRLAELGYMFEEMGDKKSIAKAQEFYEKAVEKGCIKALINLSSIYLTQGLIEKAIRCNERVIELNNEFSPVAFDNLGRMYAIKKDFVRAFKNFEIAALAGNADAQMNLGICYRDGCGCERSVETAVNYFQQAAVQGNTNAMYTLAVHFHRENDFEKSNHFFMLGAKKNNPLCQFHVGLFCLQGEGGFIQSMEEAINWLTLAAQADHKEAQYLLKKLYDKGILATIQKLKWKKPSKMVEKRSSVTKKFKKLKL